MTRGGAAKAREIAERRCLVTGERGGKAGLIRFVVGLEELVVPDILERMPGRGMWVTADRSIIDQAARGKVFSRGAKMQVAVPSDLGQMVEVALARRVIDLISLARKAGEAIAGYEKVKGWLDSDRAAVLIQAHDGSSRGRAKLRPPGGPESLISVLDATELGFAFGRENVIHGALAGGGLTTRVVEEAARLQGMRRKHGGQRSVGKGTTTT